MCGGDAASLSKYFDHFFVPPARLLRLQDSTQNNHTNGAVSQQQQTAKSNLGLTYVFVKIK